MDFLNKEDSNGTLIDFIKNRKKQFNGNSDEGSTQKQQILEELHVSEIPTLLFSKYVTYQILKYLYIVNDNYYWVLNSKEIKTKSTH